MPVCEHFFHIAENYTAVEQDLLKIPIYINK